MSDPAVTIIETLKDAVLVRVQAPSLDEETFWALRSDVLIAGSGAPKLPVILDMAKVSFVPSLSLGGLIRLSQEFKARPQRLVLAAVQPNVRETMAITRVDTLFEIIDEPSKLGPPPPAHG